MPLAASDLLAVPRLKMQEARLLLAEGRELGRAYDLLEQVGKVEWSEEEVIDHWSLLGTVAFKLGRFEEARSHYRHALDLVETAQASRDRAHLYFNFAVVTIAEATGEAARATAVAEVRRALQVATETDQRSIQLVAFAALGRLLEGEEAGEQLAKCLQLEPRDVSCLTASAFFTAPKDAVLARQRFETAVQGAKASADRWPLIFLWSDRLPLLWATRGREEAIAGSFEALDEIEQLRGQQGDSLSQASFFSVWADAYRWVFGRLLDETGREPSRRDFELAFEVSERFRARSLLETLEIAGVETSPPTALAKLSAIQPMLAEDEALVIFQVAPGRNVYGRFGGGSWMLTIHRGGIRGHRLGERAEIERQARLYLGLTGKPAEVMAGPAARLYHELLAAGLAELPPGVKKLIVLPDGVLHNLPWGTLRESAEAPLLTERYELSLISSVTLWQHWRQRVPEPATSPALVLADPKTSQLVLAAGISPVRAGPALGPLPRARREGKAVVRHLGGSSLLLTGDKASEHFIKTAELRDYGILHIAAHAVVDDTLPQRSFVLLASGAEGEDGELHMTDIVDLDLEDRVVVLAACRGASGRVLQGEGVMSLARAFFQAGARAVVASLWPLDDRAAAELFDIFYRELGRGVSLGQALKNAQQQRLREGASVSEWAGVVVLGDASTVPNPGGSTPPRTPLASRPGVIAGVAFLLATLAFLAWRRRRKVA